MKALILAMLLTGCGATIGPFPGPQPQPEPPDPWNDPPADQAKAKPVQSASPTTPPRKP